MEISYLFLAEGFEEVEALTVVDMMRRAGMEIRTVSITDEKVVSGAHGIPVSADMLLKEVDFGTAEWLILPGGMPGSKNLGGCARLVDALKVHAAAEKPLAAICAAPFVLGVNGMLENRAATCYPGFEGMLHGAVWLRSTGTSLRERGLLRLWILLRPSSVCRRVGKPSRGCEGVCCWISNSVGLSSLQ